VVAHLEHVRPDFVAWLQIAGGVDAELPQHALGGDTRLGEMTRQRLVAARFLDLAKANLNGVVSVAIRCLALNDHARPGFQKGDLNPAAIFRENPGHAQFTP
jgi:hypothetical protein